MEYKYNPYFMDSILADLHNSKLQKEREPNAGLYDSKLGNILKPINFNVSSEGGVTNYSGSIGTEGRTGTGRYNYGVNANKTEGMPIGYGIYGGVSNQDFGVQANAGSGGYGISGYYVPYGLNASYQNNAGQRQDIRIGYQKGFNF